MKNLKSYSLFALGLLLCINQGFNLVLGSLSESGELRGADALMPMDLPLYVLLFTQKDGTLKSRYRGFILTLKIFLLLFWILTMMGEFVAMEPAEFRVQMFHLSRALLIAYVIMTRVSTFVDLRAFVLGLLSSLAFESFVGAWQWQIGPLNIPFLAASSGFRVAGTIGVPNAYGAWLITLVPLGLRMGLYTKLKPRFFWQGVMVVSLTCLLATYTRGAWLSFLATTAIFTLIDFFKRRLSGKQIALFISMAAVLAVVITVKYGFAIKARMADTDETLTGDKKSSRMYLAQDAMRIIKSNQVFGVGLDNYRYHADPEIQGTRIVHNVYLLVCAEQGVPTAVLFVLFMMLVVLRGWKLLSSKISFFYHTGVATICGILNLSLYYMIGLDYNLFELLFQHWRLIGLLPAILVCEEHTLKQLAKKQKLKQSVQRSSGGTRNLPASASIPVKLVGSANYRGPSASPFIRRVP